MPDVAETHREPHRYTVSCWRDDCPGALDTYGESWVLDLAREHVREHGCKLTVEVKSIIEIGPVETDEERVCICDPADEDYPHPDCPGSKPVAPRDERADSS